MAQATQHLPFPSTIWDSSSITDCKVLSLIFYDYVRLISDCAQPLAGLILELMFIESSSTIDVSVMLLETCFLTFLYLS